jgi:protein tyrosine phosphatase type 4A
MMLTLQELHFEDGASPPDDIISQWLELVSLARNSPDNPTIAVHCVAGLGRYVVNIVDVCVVAEQYVLCRAPVLVAIALIEFGDMDPIAAVTFIREKRRGAINAVQLNYLESYRKRGGKSAGGAGKCTIM